MAIVTSIVAKGAIKKGIAAKGTIKGGTAIAGAAKTAGAVGTGAAKKGGILATCTSVGGMMMKGAGTAANVASGAASVASSGISAMASIAKLGLKAATVCVGLIGGGIKCINYLRERSKAKKKAKKEEKEKEEAMKKGVIPGFAYQSHYGSPNPNSPQNSQQGGQPSRKSDKKHEGKLVSDDKPKDSKGALVPTTSTVFDKRTDEDRRREGSYVDGDIQVTPTNKPASDNTPAKKPIDKKSTSATYKELTRKPSKPTSGRQGKDNPKKPTPPVTKPNEDSVSQATTYKGLGSAPKKETLTHDMSAIKKEVEDENKAEEERIYFHQRQALIDKCNNDLQKLKADYKVQKEAYKNSQKGVRKYVPGSGKLCEAQIEGIAAKFKTRQEKLEQDLAELDRKHGKTPK